MKNDDNAAPIGKPEANGKRGGRPRALDDASKRFVCKLVARGAAVADAAALIDVSRKTIDNERRRDPDFHADLRRALAVARAEPREVVVEAAKTNWRAAAFLMKHMLMLEERRQPPREGSASTSRSRKAKMKLAAEEEPIESAPPSEEKARFGQSTPVFTKPRFSAS